MTPLAPVMQQSTQANANVAEINGAVAPRLDGIQAQMGMLAGQITSFSTKNFSIECTGHHQRMSEIERQPRDITAGRSSVSGVASSPGSSEPQPELARGSIKQHPPKHQRTVLVVGGFPYDTERDVMCEKLREIFDQEPGVSERWTQGKVGSVKGVNSTPHTSHFLVFHSTHFNVTLTLAQEQGVWRALHTCVIFMR